MNAEIQKIQKTLVSLGITANYTGFNYMTSAVSLALKEPVRLQYVTKLIYPDVAGEYGTGAGCVERSIRTVSRLSWERNPTLLCRMAGYPLKKRPSNSALLAIVTIWLSSDLLSEKVSEEG